MLETLMNPQFGLEQVVLSPKGKSQALTEHATHALDLRRGKRSEKVEIECGTVAGVYFWASMQGLASSCHPGKDSACCFEPRESLFHAVHTVYFAFFVVEIV